MVTLYYNQLTHTIFILVKYQPNSIINMQD